MALCVGGRWQHGRLNLKKKNYIKKMEDMDPICEKNKTTKRIEPRVTWSRDTCGP